jgi:Flp pilus assembly protein TadG
MVRAYENQSMRSPLRLPRRRGAPHNRRQTLLRDENGAAAIEFAIVALPFLLFLFAILGYGLYFFTATSLESGVENAARKVRTGQAQKGELTVGDFKQLVCQEAGSYISCNKLTVLLQSGSEWSDVTPLPCVDDENNQADSTGTSTEAVSNYTGEASQVVLVTVCYQWDLAEVFSFLGLGKGADGGGPAILQAATAFRTEPYQPS